MTTLDERLEAWVTSRDDVRFVRAQTDGSVQIGYADGRIVVASRDGLGHVFADARSTSGVTRYAPAPRPLGGLAGIAGAAEKKETEPGVLRAATGGTLKEVRVALGARVGVGDIVAVVEVMKMEIELVADVEGNVAELGAEAGATLGRGDLVARIR